ncbi:hypothetical protein BGX21_003997 [Mortierella sp. AD011]|nr:hypothetical protein BGX20_003859 [Mortierella sp. AD010]KAF9374901.1 hypothetical protein BGX21_003997 [Mortierella sp. AD011]
MVGEMTGVDSTARRNNKMHMKMETPQETKNMGVRADFIWRSLYTPEKDWAIGEAARVWDELSPKYADEANFKLPRQQRNGTVVFTRYTVKTHDDVTSLWGCEPGQIKILGLDLGQACVLRAGALLPPKGITRSEVRKIVQRNLIGGGEDIDLGKSRNTSTSTRPPVAFHNLAEK